MTGSGPRKPIGAVALGAFLTGCGRNLPQSSLEPAGPYAQKIHSLFVPVVLIAAGIFLLVEGALLYFLFRYRYRPGRETMPRQIHGSPRLEIAWTIAPAVVLAVVAVPTIRTIYELAERPTDALRVRVVAHQWWWEFEYPDLGIVTANELHIPTGRQILVELESADVIHSFGVPRLAGKQDNVPGRTNFLVLQADEPGTYPGQCFEFCGLSHANMRFRVIAQTREDFEAWVRAQRGPAAEPRGELAREGSELFQTVGCAACHAIEGTPAQGVLAPNLTHFASRSTFAGATYERTARNLARWLDNPDALKPGAKMPDLGLRPDQIEALVAYLQGLR